jgi:hypothetical protein
VNNGINAKNIKPIPALIPCTFECIVSISFVLFTLNIPDNIQPPIPSELCMVNAAWKEMAESLREIIVQVGLVVFQAEIAVVVSFLFLAANLKPVLGV